MPGTGWTGLGVADGTAGFEILRYSDAPVTTDDDAIVIRHTLPPPMTAGQTTTATVTVAGVVRRGNERVLLVEDDAFIRSMLTRFLQREGYRITAAMDGPSALEAWATAQGQFDLLITDMVMPNGLSGAQLAERLRGQNPRLKAILISGYSPELLDADAEQLRSIRMLMKPFTHEKIIETMREVLDAPDAG